MRTQAICVVSADRAFGAPSRMRLSGAHINAQPAADAGQQQHDAGQRVNGSGLTVRLSGSSPGVGIFTNHSIAPSGSGSNLYTPGATNSVNSALAPLPLVWQVLAL